MLEEQPRVDDLRDKEKGNRYRWVMPAASAGAALAAGLLLVVAAYLINQGADIQNLLTLGYPGVSVVMFFSSATVLLPAPGFATVIAASGIGNLNPWVLGLFAALGSSLGELTGYLVGIGGRTALQHAGGGAWIRRCEFFMRRWGFMTIFVMASIPNPFFDAVGVLAGSLGYPARRLWVACLLGNMIKYTAIALIGGTAASLFFSE